MTRCLSDDALMRVTAELGTPAQQSHLTMCAPCAMRYRRLAGDLGVIRQVLAQTNEPRRRTVPSRLRTVAGMAALSAVAVAALLWIEVTAWKALQPERELASTEQFETALADVQAALFSVNGEPARIRSEDEIENALVSASEASAECDTQISMGSIPCAAGMSGFGESTEAGDTESSEATEMEAMDHTTSDAQRADQGG
jgi:hypothetical protein